MPVPTIEWVGSMNKGRIKIVDQTLLPERFKFINCKDIESIWEAIKVLRVRGAPALGVSAAFAVILGIRGVKTEKWSEFKKELNNVIKYVGSSRPTAVNLFWALEKMKAKAIENSKEPVEKIKKILFEEAKRIMTHDKETCRAIGEHGKHIIKHGDTILTHCNAGGLATADYGTALAPMFAAKEDGIKFKVFADETRPLLQGARLTVWELMHAKIDVTLICDNMAGFVMKQGKITKIITGADRIAANGDAANKIGTYSVAVLAKAHKIPMYIAAPQSTFDMSLDHGDKIPIEERDPDEIRRGFKCLTAPAKAKVFNPAFDVTPAKYITGFITEKGIIKPPFKTNLKKAFG